MMTTYTQLVCTVRHHQALTKIHDKALTLHAEIIAEREATYGADVPVAVAHLLDLADDTAGALESALKVLLSEASPDQRRKYGPKRKEAA